MKQVKHQSYSISLLEWNLSRYDADSLAWISVRFKKLFRVFKVYLSLESAIRKPQTFFFNLTSTVILSQLEVGYCHNSK